MIVYDGFAAAYKVRLTTGEARILVGPAGTEFTVNIKTICDKSAFFAKAKNGIFTAKLLKNDVF